MDNMDMHKRQEQTSELSTQKNVPREKSNSKKNQAKRGKKVHLYTNYVRVFVDNTSEIHEYRLTFSPPVDNLEIRKKFLTQFENVLGTIRVFDGISLFLPIPLNDKTTLLAGFHPNQRKLALKATVSYEHPNPHRQMVQFFNVLLRRMMVTIGKFEINRSFFDPDIKSNLPQYKLQIWPGLCTSVEEQEDGLMLCLDTSFRVFRTDSVYDYLCALSDRPHWKQEFTDYILRKVVITRYNNFTYKIDDIDWANGPNTVFDCDGKQMTYKDYYKSQYNIEIVDQNQPLLLSRVNVKVGHKETTRCKVVSIIPELCYETGMNRDQRNDQATRKEISRYTFSSPAQKLKALSSFIDKVQEIPEALNVLNEWGVRLDTKPLQVCGREIPGPSLRFNSESIVHEADSEFISDTNEGYYDAVSIKHWLIICSQKDVKYVKRFRECYKSISHSTGVQMRHEGDMVILKGHNPQDYRDALEGYVDPKQTQFVVVVMPFVRREIYSVVKTICCVERPVPSQVVLAKHLMNTTYLMSVVKNLAMQINCKLGGALWGLRIPLKEKIMFVGIDVYHDVKKFQPSAVALIASLNNSCTKYFSKVSIQKIHQEITDNTKPLFAEALECFFDLNEGYPDRIIVFRDGGSLSTMKLLIEHEVKPMLSALADLCPQVQNFVYSIVSKRVPQRFFLKDQKGHIQNPNPGTIIDDNVTYPNMYDFYLVSQRMTHRVINPTHYMVIHELGETKPDLLQQLAYSTTYMYYNWCGSIRVPAMIQYAHKLASLVGNYLRTDPASSLETKLYYL